MTLKRTKHLKSKADWEAMCRANDLRPLHKENTVYGEVLIAEGYRMGDPFLSTKTKLRGVPRDPMQVFVESYPHYMIVWAIYREGKGLDLASMIKVNALGFREPQERIAECLKEVHLWIKDNVEVGRYYK